MATNKKEIKVVIGANFGDEGKGLVTDFLSFSSVSSNKRTIVVMSNGGSQRGHTVNCEDGRVHTFKHFGSGGYVGADTFFPSAFILNPMQFSKEYLENSFIRKTNIYCCCDCRWSTPYDMLVNQIVEECRDKGRHGSCGFGIWETVNRYEHGISLGQIFTFNLLSREDKIKQLKFIRDNYFVNRLKELGVSSVPSSWRNIFYSDILIDNFISDVSFLCGVVIKCNYFVLKMYDTIVFENGQGLLLDRNATFYGDNTTPSNTGSKNSFDIISKVFGSNDIDIELCYVSRTYMTRHGAGTFVTECKKEKINPNMIDEVNVENEFQGKLRYGELIIESLMDRIIKDAEKFTVFSNVKKSLVLTHTNENPISITDENASMLDSIYVSYSRFRSSIRSIK